MATGAELIRQIKERIEEVDPRDVHDLVEAGPNGTVIVDVREQHEFEEAHLPGAKHVPRGLLVRQPGVIRAVVAQHAVDHEADEKDAIATVNNKQEEGNFSNAMAEAFKAAKGE